MKNGFRSFLDCIYANQQRNNFKKVEKWCGSLPLSRGAGTARNFYTLFEVRRPGATNNLLGANRNGTRSDININADASSKGPKICSRLFSDDTNLSAVI